MKTYNIVYTDIAYNNIFEIERYISNQLYNPQAAKSLLAELNNAVENIAQFPYSGTLSRNQNLALQSVRFKVVENYIIFYYPNDERQEIIVLYVKYGGSDLTKLKK